MSSLRLDHSLWSVPKIGGLSCSPEKKTQATTLDIENEILDTLSLREATSSRLVWH